MIVRTKKPRILIVDDSMEQQDMLTEMLLDNYDIISAFNGNQALRMARTDPQPDLILMDIIMPSPDGFEVCSILKAEERTEGIPIVLTSGMGDGRIGKKAAQSGASAYLNKPFSLLKLNATLDKFLTPLTIA
nr:response regulator [Spirochaeta isovalerica]